MLGTLRIFRPAITKITTRKEDPEAVEIREIKGIEGVRLRAFSNRVVSLKEKFRTSRQLLYSQVKGDKVRVFNSLKRAIRMREVEIVVIIVGIEEIIIKVIIVGIITGEILTEEIPVFRDDVGTAIVPNI